MEKQHDRLIELVKDARKVANMYAVADMNETIADYLLANGVVVLPCKVGNMVDVFFSHNAIVHLWCVDPVEEDYSTSLWRGMAWDIPQKYKEMKFEKFFGTVPEHLYEADAINILVDLTKEEAEAALKGGVKE